MWSVEGTEQGQQENADTRTIFEVYVCRPNFYEYYNHIDFIRLG